MVFHWSLINSKSPQVYRTLLSILAVLNNAVFWMISTRPPTSKSSSPFNNPLVIVPKAPITIGIIVTFMFHSFFQFLGKVQVLILLFTFFQFYSDIEYNKIENSDSCFQFLIELIFNMSDFLTEQISSFIPFPSQIRFGWVGFYIISTILW